MGYFPMCIDLKGRKVLLVGEGKQTDQKMKKLLDFGCIPHRVSEFRPEDLTEDVAFVVVGDTPREEAARISSWCIQKRIPVNVVDDPSLCTFFFPALITKGDLTVSVSTGGRTPGAAAFLAEKIEAQLPDGTEEILDWLCGIRQVLYRRFPKEAARRILAVITRQSFDSGRPLTEEEIESLTACSGQVTGNL